MKPKFEHPAPILDVSKLAYDLALIYARTKFVEQLRNDPEHFSHTLVPPDVEELDFLRKQFLFAYDHYTADDPGDIERAWQNLGN